MKSSIIYGYGFLCECSDQSLIKFIESHSNTFCASEKETMLYQRIMDPERNVDNLEDVFDDYSCDATGRTGIGAVISNIMSRETGIRFEYCGPDEACGTKASVVFGDGFPWSFNEIEKNLTPEKLESICKCYENELEIVDEPDYLMLEYYG